MKADLEQIEAQARGLSDNDRARLAESMLESLHESLADVVENLWDSIASDQNALPLTTEQRAELDRRLDAYELDRDPGRPAEDVIAEIRGKL